MNSIGSSIDSFITPILSQLLEMGVSVWAYIQTYPLTSLVIVSLIVAFGVLSFKVIKYIYVTYIRRKSTEFFSLISNVNSVAILLHPHPDPDAMGSGLAVQKIAEEVDTDAEIYYSGQITHHENRAFLAVLDLAFTQVKDASEITEDLVVVVDHVEPRGFRKADTISPDAIIDHHDASPSTEPEFMHIETDIGSCATLLTEYLTEQDVITEDMSNTQSPPDITEKLATGLYYGIKTDTSDFSRGVNKRDYQSAQIIYPYTNTDDLFKIANPKIDMETFEIKAKSFYSLETDGPFGISDVGDVANSDAIPQSADELVQLEGVSAIIVIGDVGDEFRLSGRTYDDRVHMGMALENVVAQLPNSSAGGHSRMGGGQIQKNDLEEEGVTISKLKSQLFDSLKGIDTETTDNSKDPDMSDESVINPSTPKEKEDKFIYDGPEETEETL